MSDYQPSLLLRVMPHFRLRRTEWIAAIQSVIWGLVLLAPVDTFAGPAFTFFRFMPEEMWGAIMLVIGGLRLTGLIINGSRRTITPWMRLASAIVGWGMFTAVSLCFASSGIVSTWIAAWPVAAVIELMNIHDTAHDARQARG